MAFNVSCGVSPGIELAPGGPESYSKPDGDGGGSEPL